MGLCPPCLPLREGLGEGFLGLCPLRGGLYGVWVGFWGCGPPGAPQSWVLWGLGWDFGVVSPLEPLRVGFGWDFGVVTPLSPPRPLHIAARNGLASVVQALLSRGATVLAVDEEGGRAPGVLGVLGDPGGFLHSWEVPRARGVLRHGHPKQRPWAGFCSQTIPSQIKPSPPESSLSQIIPVPETLPKPSLSQIIPS